MYFNLFLCLYNLLQVSASGMAFEHTDSHFEKCKEFEKQIGKPNIYYNEDNDLVMVVKIYRGKSNRVIDSGMTSVGIQLREDRRINMNDELIRFLSQVLEIKQSSFTILSEHTFPFKTVSIKGSVINAYELIDKLVAALEVTAREEPLALCITDNSEPEETDRKHASQEIDAIQEFDWRNKNME